MGLNLIFINTKTSGARSLLASLFLLIESNHNLLRAIPIPLQARDYPKQNIEMLDKLAAVGKPALLETKCKILIPVPPMQDGEDPDKYAKKKVLLFFYFSFSFSRT